MTILNSIQCVLLLKFFTASPSTGACVGDETRRGGGGGGGCRTASALRIHRNKTIRRSEDVGILGAAEPLVLLAGIIVNRFRRRSVVDAFPVYLVDVMKTKD